jgi:hypothetical protein
LRIEDEILEVIQGEYSSASL